MAIPNIMVVVGLAEVERPWERTVDSRNKIASAPLSSRALVPVLSAHIDSGAVASSHDSLSRLSGSTPRRMRSSAMSADIAFTPFFPLFLVEIVDFGGLFEVAAGAVRPSPPRL